MLVGTVLEDLSLNLTQTHWKHLRVDRLALSLYAGSRSDDGDSQREKRVGLTTSRLWEPLPSSAVPQTCRVV